MKMRLKSFLAFALLSITILSYGVSGSAFADNHNIAPITASAELPTYRNGGEVVLSGNLKNYDPNSGSAITFVIKSPDNNLVTIGQLTPNSDGSFQHTFTAGGPLWKSSGDYIVDLRFEGNSSEVKIIYTGGDAPTTTVTCGSNETLVNGVCIENEPTTVTCGSNETLVNGVCIENEPEPTCGAGTELVNGICQVIKTDDEPKPTGGGGCLIATAAYGTELAPQVQFLREIRDNTVMSTASGTSFMTGFNQLYYSFSPTIADMERENPMFQEVVRVFITPMISTLSIMTLAEDGSEVEVLGLGISVIALNLGMYVAAPALIGFKVHSHFKSRK